MNSKGSELTVGSLRIVATPIGNLAELSERAGETLRSCDLIACEDTRVTAKLLAHVGAKVPTTSYREENERRKAIELADDIQHGKTIALVSDAGFPAISDPGFRLVRECRRRGLPVVPISGPNAAVVALAASGLPTDKFLFLGFLPPKTAARRKAFEQWKHFSGSLVLYESKHRVMKALADMEEIFGPERVVCLARELTKIHETFHVGSLAVVREELGRGSTKGEFVLVVSPEGYEL